VNTNSSSIGFKSPNKDTRINVNVQYEHTHTYINIQYKII